MSKKIFFLIVGVSLLFLVINGLQNVYSVEGPVSPQPAVKEVKEIKPENKIGIAHTEIFDKLERPQVIFEHQKHVDALKEEKEGCEKCHPQDVENKLIFDFPKKADKKDEKSIMNAYHDECIGCHKDRYKETKKTGPVTCAECHKKEFTTIKVKYPVFEFDFAYHDNHVKKLKEKLGKDDCSLCHHTYDIEEEDEALALVYEEGTEESCYYCHDLEAKRGPKLTAVTNVAAKKGLSLRKASHNRCVNCHLENEKELAKKKVRKKDEKTGHTECSKCHNGEYKTIAELQKIPRPDRDQPEKPFINIKDAKMKGVLFDHKLHEKNQKTCRGCHHETLNTCKECHTLTGNPDGKWVNIANAYHDVFSGKSCAGCHGLKKAEKDCAGCHGFLKVMDIETKGPKKETCAVCHTGEKQRPDPKPISVASIDPDKVKKEVEVKILEKEYKPAKFPHLEIVKKLVKISNDSKMATYFHGKLQTICEGCHHQSRAEAEVKKDTPPYCRNCHSISFDIRNINRPRLVAAYHGQCAGCHEYMKLEKGRKCKECHEEKAVRPTDIITKYDEPSLK
ncbi:MAG: sulfate respiration complex hexadecaheme cytochrome HmcA [Nitrospirota bacterium]